MQYVLATPFTYMCHYLTSPTEAKLLMDIQLRRVFVTNRIVVHKANT